MRPTLTLLTALAVTSITGAAATGAAAQAPSSPGRQVAAALRADVLRGHLEFLADDALEGRAPGTRGGLLAQKYIGTQFRRLGLEPAGDSGTYYQRVPIISLTPSPTLAATGPSPMPLKWKDDYVLWSMRNDSSVKVRGEAVFAGYGIVAPEVGRAARAALAKKQGIRVLEAGWPTESSAAQELAQSAEFGFGR